MKRWTVAGLFLLALALIVSEVRGDLIGPRRQPPPAVPPGFNPFAQPGAGRPLPVKVKLVVQVSEKYKVPVLQVPVNLALGQQANAGGGVGEAPEAQPDRRFGLATLVAGLALTLAFASGGLWLVRRGSGRTLAIVGAVSLLAAGTAVVWANGAIPPNFRRQPAAPPPAKPAAELLKLPVGVELSDKLILEPMPPGDHVTLIMPKAMVLDKGKEAGSPRQARPLT